MKLQENSVFANRYELQRLLGRGGFSEVWLAKDEWTRLNVAIKVYAPGQGMEEDGMKEFCGELAGVYDINHPNLLKPQHVDTWENMPYLIMAYCPNGSCAKMIGKATEEQMWKVIHDVASGLAYLHGKGLVHQDIKPANVMIDEDGDYLITDFGVSSRARSTLRKSVVSSTGGGTTAYMGPERFSQQPAPTKASDIWSFGAMCFEMVEGYVPFGENGGVSQKIGADIPLMSAGVSDALKYAITMMLQKETWDRPTAATLMEWSANPAAINVDKNLINPKEEHHETADAGRTTVRQRDIPVSEPAQKETVGKSVADAMKSEPVNQPKVNKKMWIVIGVMAVMICVLCVIAFGGKSDNPEMPEEEHKNEDCIDTSGVRDTLSVVHIDTVKITQEEDSEKKKNEIKDKESKSKEHILENNKHVEATQTITVNGVTFKMIGVVGKTFKMRGRSITLKNYYIGQTEVTQALWKAVMGTTVRQQRDMAKSKGPIYGEGPNYPMYYISWNDCQMFIQKLNQLTGCKFSLPTEAQWEYAARGGNKSLGYDFSGSNCLDSVGWYSDSGGNIGIGPQPVATKKANELGIYDMSGNVDEWCQDKYYKTNYITRGGSFCTCRGRCKTNDSQCNEEPNSIGVSIGLRLVMLP